MKIFGSNFIDPVSKLGVCKLPNAGRPEKFVQTEKKLNTGKTRVQKKMEKKQEEQNLARRKSTKAKENNKQLRLQGYNTTSDTSRKYQLQKINYIILSCSNKNNRLARINKNSTETK